MAEVTKGIKVKTRKREGTKAKVLLWTGTERAPRRRWWWWAIMNYVALFLTVLFFMSGEWSIALLVVGIAVSLNFVYGSKPRPRSYRLDGKRLKVDQLEISLEDFKSSFLDTPWRAEKEVSPTAVLVLIPHKRFGLPLSVFLPDEEKQRARILEALTKQVPVTIDAGFAWNLRVLDWFVRRLHL